MGWRPDGPTLRRRFAAALGAAGQGTDAEELDDKERTRLREQALAWLRADLGRVPASTRRAIIRRYATCSSNGRQPDLAGVRDANRRKSCRPRSRRRGGNCGSMSRNCSKSLMWCSRRALELKADDQKAFSLRAQAHENLGQWDQGACRLLQAHRVGSRRRVLVGHRGHVRTRLKQRDERFRLLQGHRVGFQECVAVGNPGRHLPCPRAVGQGHRGCHPGR